MLKCVSGMLKMLAKPCRNHSIFNTHNFSTAPTSMVSNGPLAFTCNSHSDNTPGMHVVGMLYERYLFCSMLACNIISAVVLFWYLTTINGEGAW